MNFKDGEKVVLLNNVTAFGNLIPKGTVCTVSGTDEKITRIVTNEIISKGGWWVRDFELKKYSEINHPHTNIFK